MHSFHFILFICLFISVIFFLLTCVFIILFIDFYWFIYLSIYYLSIYLFMFCLYRNKTRYIFTIKIPYLLSARSTLDIPNKIFREQLISLKKEHHYAKQLARRGYLLAQSKIILVGNTQIKPQGLVEKMHWVLLRKRHWQTILSIWAIGDFLSQEKL